jgi:pyrimidine-nucleoside phosphorylase
MRMYDVIEKKRNGGELTEAEIQYFVKGCTNGEIPDYQMSALLMAIYFQKMTYEETLHLTLAMADSGDRLDLSGIKGIKADKHSTGGIGDKTTLVVCPMAAALGVKIAKMSGRGLGYTGGTIDKLESIPGFSTALSEQVFFENVEKIGFALTGQTGNLAPADKKIYALRDVTATVDVMPLIASSIMSKKIASGADAIVLDVKSGSGAFMKNEKDAIELAKEMVKIGTGAGRKTSAVISSMDEPLGFAVGNALEVVEAVNTLRGKGPADLLELAVVLGSHMVVAAGLTKDYKEAEKMLYKTIDDGSAYKKFMEFVISQGGRRENIENPETLVNADIVEELCAPQSGYISDIQSEEIGNAVMMLGGGRETKESEIDLSVGIVLRKKTGDYVKKGEPLAVVYANDSVKYEAAVKRLLAAFSYSEVKKEKGALVKGVVTSASL